MTSYFKFLAKADTEASLWAKDNQPKLLIKKDPLGLRAEPKFAGTKIPVFDGILGPAVGIVNSLAAMNNSIVHFTENLRSFGAMIQDMVKIDKTLDAKGFDKMVGNLFQFGIFDKDDSLIATIDCEDKVKIVDQGKWDDLEKKCKLPKDCDGLMGLATNLGEWLDYVNKAIESQKQFAAEPAKVVLDPVKTFPQLIGSSDDRNLNPDPDAPTGVINDRAPWVERHIAYKQRKWGGTWSCCKGEEYERVISLEELLRRKKARTRSGRNAQIKAAKRIIKKLKAEEQSANDIYADKERLKVVFTEADKDGGGTLDFDELKALFKKMKLPKEDVELDEMIRTADQDGSGEIDFDEFAEVQKTIAANKRAEYEKWDSDPVLKRVKTKGCQRPDRIRFYKLNWTDDNGKLRKGSRTEGKLMRELMGHQKVKDAVVKDWTKIIMDGLAKCNNILTLFRKTFIEASTEKISIATVFNIVRAKLADFAKAIGLSVDGSADKPAIRFIKSFKNMFMGKNPITGIAIVGGDGNQVKIDFNKGVQINTTDGILKFIFTTFFNFESHLNIVNIFSKLASKVHLLVKDCVKLGVRVSDFAMKCLPPFPIIGIIQQQVMRVCIQGAMSLDFKLRKVPGYILGNVKKFGGFAMICYAFAKSSRGLIKNLASMCPKSLTKKIADEPEEEEESDEVSADDMGDTFKRGQSRAEGASAGASAANAEQSKMKLSKQDKKEEQFVEEKDDDGEDDDEPPAKAGQVMPAKLDTSDATLEFKFAEIDADGDGSLSRQEFENALAADEFDFTPEQIEKMYSAADIDKNNEVDLEEFKAAMRAAVADM